jgi:hypothetical protein
MQISGIKTSASVGIKHTHIICIAYFHYWSLYCYIFI